MLVNIYISHDKVLQMSTKQFIVDILNAFMLLFFSLESPNLFYASQLQNSFT